MSIDRKQISEKFFNLILKKYEGKHKDLLLYLTPIIFENNPSLNCRYKCNENIRKQVPERRKMQLESDYGMAIGNLTAQTYGYQKSSKQVITYKFSYQLIK